MKKVLLFLLLVIFGTSQARLSYECEDILGVAELFNSEGHQFVLYVPKTHDGNKRWIKVFVDDKSEKSKLIKEMLIKASSKKHSAIRIKLKRDQKCNDSFNGGLHTKYISINDIDSIYLSSYPIFDENNN